MIPAVATALFLAGGLGPAKQEAAAGGVLERAARARGGAAALRALRSLQIDGTIAFFDPEGKESEPAPFRAFLRFPDRARFEFGGDEARRVWIVRGETVHERSEGSASFSAIEGEAAESIRRNVLLHLVAARFPALPEPLVVDETPDGSGRHAIGPAPGGLAARFRPGEDLPAALEFEGPPPESFRLEEWSEPAGRLRSARVVRAEVDGRPIWVERIERWVPNPMLLERFFEPPEPGAGTLGSPTPVTDSIRIVRAPAVPLREVVAAKSWEGIAPAAASIRSAGNEKGLILVLVSGKGKSLEVALVASEPGGAAKRLLAEGEIGELFVRGTLAEALDAVERIRAFLEEEGGRSAGEPATISRHPDDWTASDSAEGLFRVAVPIRRQP